MCVNGILADHDLIFTIINQFGPRSGPEIIKLFACLTQLSMKFQLLIKIKMPVRQIKKFLTLILSV